jgi:hypothetical protein
MLIVNVSELFLLGNYDLLRYFNESLRQFKIYKREIMIAGMSCGYLTKLKVLPNRRNCDCRYVFHTRIMQIIITLAMIESRS